MELFARFMLDSIRIFLQPFHVLAQVRVFFFKLLNLVLELLLLAALAVPGGKPVTAVHHAPRESEGKGNGEDGARRTPSLLKPLDGPLTQWKRLGGRFLFWTEQIWLLHLASAAKF